MDDPAKERTYRDISIGDEASFEVTITEDIVRQFASISGDRNPLHMDEGYAHTTSFGERVAHGMIIGALFSRLIGMELPGKYSVYLSQSLKFHSPVALGMRLTIRGGVTHKTDAAKTVMIDTTAEDAGSKNILVSGEAMVQLLR